MNLTDVEYNLLLNTSWTEYTDEVYEKYPNFIYDKINNSLELESDFFNKVPERFINRKVCLEAVKKSGETLKYVPEELKDREICLEAVKNNEETLKYVPEELKDREIYLEAVKNNEEMLKYVPYIMDREFYLEVIRNNGLALQYVPYIIDREICLEAVRNNGLALQYVPYKLIDIEICLEAVKYKGSALDYVPEEFKDRELCLKAIKTNAIAIWYTPKEFIDRELCLIAVKNNGSVLNIKVPYELRDRELCLAAVKNKGSALEGVPGELIDREFCLEAVKNDGSVLKYVPEEFKDREICLIAVKTNAIAFWYVPEEFKDRELCLIAVKSNGSALKHVPYELKDRKFYFEAVKNNGEMLMHVPKELIDREFINSLYNANNNLSLDLEFLLIYSKDFKYYIKNPFKYLEFTDLIDERLCEMHGIDYNLINSINNKSIVHYSSNFQTEYFVEFIKKMKSILTEENLYKLINIPEQLTLDHINENIDLNNISDIYNVNVEIEGEFSVVVNFFKDWNLSNKELFSIFQEINRLLDEDISLSQIFAILDINSNQVKIKDKFEKFNKSLSEIKINSFEDEINDLSQEFETQSNYFVQILSNSLLKYLSLDKKIDIDEIKLYIENEFNRKKENGTNYYSQHVFNLKDRMIVKMINFIESNNETLSITSVDTLRKYKNQLQKGWIRKLMNIKLNCSLQELKDQEELLNFEIDHKKIYTMKNDVDSKVFFENLSKLGLDNIFTYEKMETMFSAIRPSESTEVNEYFNKYLFYIANNDELYVNFYKLYNNFEKLYSFPIVRSKIIQGTATPEYLIRVIDSFEYKNVEADEINFSKDAKLAGLTQLEFDAAKVIYRKANLKIGRTIPPVNRVMPNFQGRIVRCDEPLIILAGNVTDCCQKVFDVGAGSAAHGALEHNGSIFVVERINSETGKVEEIVAQSWVWRNNSRVCFDNIEIPKRVKANLTLDEQEEILNIYKEAGKAMIATDEKFYQKLLDENKITKDVYDAIVLSEVTVGLGYNDLVFLEQEVNNKNLSEASSVKPIEIGKKYDDVDKGVYLDSTKQYILAQSNKEKSNNSTYNMDYAYKNARFVIIKLGKDITIQDINQIKNIEEAVYRDSQIVMENVADFVSLGNKYGLNSESIELMTNNMNEWYILAEEKDDYYYVADLALKGGLNSEKNVEYQVESKIATLEVATTLYKRFISIAKKGKYIFTNATKDTAYLNLKNMESKNLIKIISDTRGSNMGNVELNDVKFEINIANMEKELERLNKLLSFLYDRRMLESVQLSDEEEIHEQNRSI